MAIELIRIDVIEHKAPGVQSNGKIKKGGGDAKSKTKTPEEQREANAKKAARAKATADRQRALLVRNGIVYTSMAVRKMAQVTGEIAHLQINQSYNRQIFAAQMSGDTHKSQLLQNKKTKANATTSFITTTLNNAASVAAGFAIRPVLGAIQLATYMVQMGIDFFGRAQQFAEDMRQYKVQAERQLTQSEYMRKRLLLNTFNNRGFF